MRVNLAYRIFLIAYGVAMLAISVAMAIASSGSIELVHNRWLFAWCEGLSYFVLALGYSRLRNCEGTPSRVALGVVFAAALSLPLSLPFSLGDELPGWQAVALTAIVVAYLVATVTLLRELKSMDSLRSRWRSNVLAPLLALFGAGCVISSLSLKVTWAQTATGWDVAMRRAEWVTSFINVGNDGSTTIEYLQPFYAHAGYVAYILAVSATLVILISLAALKIPIHWMRKRRIFALSAIIVNLISFWILTDIFWGWHFALKSIEWAAVLATILWLIGPLLGTALLVPSLWNSNETWRFMMFITFQIPLIAFNLTMLFTYLPSHSLLDASLDLPGLGMLIVGLQLESWACLELLMLERKRICEN